jgi:hypothetical protein
MLEIIISSLVSFVLGIFFYRQLKNNAIKNAFQQAIEELKNIKTFKTIDFPPGTAQYRPVYRDYHIQVIEKISLMHNDSEFGILGYGENKVDPFPIFISHKDIDPSPIIELGDAIRVYGLKLKQKYDNE